MILLVTGGRDYGDEELMREAMAPYANSMNLLVTGAARGADRLAEDIWRDWQLPYIGVPARWDEMGRRAGPVRNGWMVRGNYIGDYIALVPDLALAFPGGSGTQNCIETAQGENVKVRRVG